MNTDPVPNDDSPGGFFFGPLESLPGDEGRIVNIPASIRSKQKLLRTLADQLQLPDYFGQNWDALEECLRDLSWLPAGNVQIRHRDLPFSPDSRDRRTYLHVLHAATAHWSESGSQRLICQFPPDAKCEVLEST